MSETPDATRKASPIGDSTRGGGGTSPDTDETYQIFTRALELDSARRPAYLAEACGSDAELQRNVESLLAAAVASATDEEWLATGGAADIDLLDSALSEASTVRQGRRLGPYRIVEELGHGGMGVVFLAQRDDGQFEQRVAIKVLPMWARVEDIERFTRERQILALLEHPNIARLYDGGLTPAPEKHPYLVMEHIDGEAIDHHCDQQRLSLRQRLELLTTVCQAVEAAHRRLIIHRDLKPSNILVTASGQPKLVDFGIAKLLAPDGEPGTAATASERMMTPQYASPEQYRGEAIGVSSDVYQLGMLAYQLLAGVKAYDLSGAAPGQAARLICDVVPEPPSAAAQKVAARGIERSRGAATRTPAAGANRIDHDLDTIVLKALHKDPRQRYGSVNQLREDFERYLAGRPVTARPDSLAYRLNKFVRRHAVAVAAAAGVVLLVAGLTLGFTLELIEERDLKRLEAQRAVEALVESERLQAESDNVVDFLVNVFDLSDPHTTKGETVTAREVLEIGAARIGRDLADQPSIRARLLQVIGNIYFNLGLYQEAEKTFEESQTILESGSRGSVLEITRSLEGRAKVADRIGQRDEANQLLRLAISRIETELDPEHPSLANLFGQLGKARRLAGDLDEAEALLRRALGLIQADPARVADAAMFENSLGTVLQDQGKLDEAEVLFKQVIATLDRELGPEHPDVTKPLNDLGVLYSMLDQPHASLPLFERALRLRERAYGPNHADVAVSVNNLGVNYLELERFEDAKAMFRRAIETVEASVGPTHPDVAQAINNLANVHLEQGEYAEAEGLYRRAMAIQAETLDPIHPQVAMTLTNLGEPIAALGRDAEAEPLFLRSLAVFEATLGIDHMVASWPALNLARLYHRRGDRERAEPLFRRAARIRQEAFEPDSPDRLEAEEALAAFLRDVGQ